jgi:hypothetical protein
MGDCHTRTARPDNKGKPYRSATAVIYPTDHGCAKEGVIAKEANPSPSPCPKPYGEP